MIYPFDPENARDRLIEELRSLAAKQGFSKVVVGISGGKDSTVTAAISARALGPENVYGVMLPDGEQKDIADSRRVCEALGIQTRTVNIGAIHTALREATDQAGPAAADAGFPIPQSRESDINVGPRIRMTVLRYIAQALGARLAGTGNLRGNRRLLHQGRRNLLRFRHARRADQRGCGGGRPDHAGNPPRAGGKNAHRRPVRLQR